MFRLKGPANNSPGNKLKFNAVRMFRDHFYSASVGFHVFTWARDPAQDFSDLRSNLLCVRFNIRKRGPEYKWPTQDLRTEAKEDAQLNWLSVVEGLIQAAIGGNVRAFVKVREIAWGTPSPKGEIPLEDLFSADEGEL